MHKCCAYGRKHTQEVWVAGVMKSHTLLGTRVGPMKMAKTWIGARTPLLYSTMEVALGSSNRGVFEDMVVGCYDMKMIVLRCNWK